MAKEANYVLKLTLAEANVTRLALGLYRSALEDKAQRLIGRREPVPVDITDDLDAAARLLARI